MKRLTEVQASMVATALVDGMEDTRLSLCCSPDSLQACSVIVGWRRAKELQEWSYDRLGCGHENVEQLQYCLDAIADAMELP